MAQKKCPACGAVYPDRHQNCPKCEFFRYREHARLKSCTGVRYPCLYSCHPCFFEKVYRVSEDS